MSRLCICGKPIEIEDEYADCEWYGSEGECECGIRYFHDSCKSIGYEDDKGYIVARLNNGDGYDYHLNYEKLKDRNEFIEKISTDVKKILNEVM